MKIKESTGATLVEKALNEGADAGVRLADLPSPHSVSLRGVVKPSDVFYRADLERIASCRTEAAALREYITENNWSNTRLRFYAEQREAIGDEAQRACLQAKEQMRAEAGLRRHAAKMRLGQVETELAKHLVGAGERLLKRCEAELAELRAKEDALSSRYGAPSHKSPLSWALGRSLAPLREALARGSAPLALLERYVGPVESK